MQKIKVLLVEDHTIVREGLRLVLKSQQQGIEIRGEAQNGQEAVEMAAEVKPDIVIMDVSLPVLNGIEATKRIKKLSPRTKVIALTMYDNAELAFQMMKAGASGYLVKNTAGINLLEAIKLIMKGNAFYCPSISTKTMGRYLERVRNQEDEELTTREKEVLRFIAESYTNKKIAKELFISVKTVRNHRYNIMEKLDIHDVASLVRYAAQRNLIDIYSPSGTMVKK